MRRASSLSAALILALAVAVLFCLPAGAQVCAGAGHDNTIYWAGLGHDSRDPMYRNPGGPVTTGTPVRLHLRSCLNDLTAARVRLYNQRTSTESYLEMSPIAADGTYQWWQATLPASAQPTLFYYFFVAVDGTSTAYYADDDNLGGPGFATGDFSAASSKSFAVTVYDPAFSTPDWLKNGIVYQVFPDRFRDGDGGNNTPAGSFFYGSNSTIVRSNSADWNQPLCDPRDGGGPCPNKYDDNFYGGDLQGVLDKLDYLQTLGVTVIYLNPVFESPSNHKYDTGDYGAVDNNLGSLSLFQSLAAQAEARGMRLVLDGEFVFTSADSLHFDLYGRYGATGACESRTAANRSWYTFWGSGPCDGQDYMSWYDYFWFPRLDAANLSVRDLVWRGTAPSATSAVSRYWLQQGASGWRLDLAGEIDPGLADPSNTFWEGFRTATRTQRADSCVIGDEWGLSTRWLLGGEWDSAVNYPFQTAVLGFWRDQALTDNNHNSGSATGPITPLTPSQFDARLRNLEERYPPQAFQAMVNILDNHDTNRALFLLDENADLYNQSLFWNPYYDWSDAIARMKGAVLLQMTLPGAPSIYYGDEVGLVGPPAFDGYAWQHYPYTRPPFPWLDQAGSPYYAHLQSPMSQGEMLGYYTKLTCARNAHPALRTGDLRTLLADDANQAYIFGRVMADYSDAAVVMVNRKGAAQTLAAGLAGYLPAGATFQDALTEAYYTVDAAGVLTVPDVPGRGGAVLVLASAISPPPPPPSNLASTEGAVLVTLAWDAAPGADRYLVFRSLLPGGGYQPIGSTTGTTYVDTGVAVEVRYYYVVRSVDDTTLLESGFSAEVSGRTCPAVGWGQVNSPATLSYTMSVFPTDPVLGKVYVAGRTDLAGQGQGISAQVGFGTGTDPTTWTWSDASYSGDEMSNDVFSGVMRPTAPGTYSYLYRFRTSPICDWTYCDRTGIGTATPGVMTVTPSPDTQPPTAPTGVTVSSVTASYIDVSWNASTDDYGVYQYEVFRSSSAGSVGGLRAILPASPLTFRDTGLVDGVTYYYTLLAVDTSANASGYSAQAAEWVTEVPAVHWDASKTGLSWDYAPRANAYTVYRGTGATLPGLLDATDDSCTRWTGTARAVTVVESLAPPDFYWYLVVGVNGAGPGSAGSATAGARVVNSVGGCP